MRDAGVREKTSSIPASCILHPDILLPHTGNSGNTFDNSSFKYVLHIAARFPVPAPARPRARMSAIDTLRQTCLISGIAAGVTLRLRRPDAQQQHRVQRIAAHLAAHADRHFVLFRASVTAMLISRSTDGSAAVYRPATSLLLRSTASAY